MPYLTTTAFNQFFGEINLPGDHRKAANERRDRIVARLENRLEVIDAFATGSIPRFTALLDHADVDVMVVLHHGKHIKDRTPENVLRSVRDALGTSAGSVRRNGQAVTLKFAEWPSVDVVPCSVTYADSAAKTVSHYTIPDMHRGEWIETRPRRHSTNIDQLAAREGENVRKLIKMIKHWNRRVGSPLQSFHIEVIALRLDTDWADLPWALYQWFEKAEELCATYLYHDGGFVDDYLDWQARPKALAQLAEARKHALTAWSATYDSKDDDKLAITTWRKVFGNAFPAYG